MVFFSARILQLFLGVFGAGSAVSFSADSLLQYANCRLSRLLRLVDNPIPQVCVDPRRKLCLGYPGWRSSWSSFFVRQNQLLGGQETSKRNICHDFNLPRKHVNFCQIIILTLTFARYLLNTKMPGSAPHAPGPVHGIIGDMP